MAFFRLFTPLPSPAGRIFRIAAEHAPEALALALCKAEALVQIQIVLRRVDDAPGDVRAVVGRALQIRQQVRPDKARLDAAISLLHPQDVTRAHLLLEGVDDLLQRLDMCGAAASCFSNASSVSSRISRSAPESVSNSACALRLNASCLPRSSSADSRTFTAWSEMRSKSPMAFRSAVASSLSSMPILRALSFTR